MLNSLLALVKTLTVDNFQKQATALAEIRSRDRPTTNRSKTHQPSTYAYGGRLPLPDPRFSLSYLRLRPFLLAAYFKYRLRTMVIVPSPVPKSPPSLPKRS
eukprot:gene19422-26079_t